MSAAGPSQGARPPGGNGAQRRSGGSYKPPVLEVRGASKHFARRPVLAERVLVAIGRAKPPPVVRAVEAVDLAIHRGEVLGLVGESGCGKSTLARLVAGIHPPTAGEVLFEGRAVQLIAGPRAARLPARRADDLPGSVRVARPADARAPHRGGGAGGASPCACQRAECGDRHGARRRGARCHVPRPVSAPVLRRAAQPHRHRPRARGEAARAGVRRARGRARRLDPVAGDQPLHGPARAPRAHLPLREPQPRAGAPHLRPGRDHVSGAHRGVGAGGRDLRAAGAPLHEGAARGDPAHQRPQARLRARAGRTAVASRAAFGLRVSPALSVCDCRMPRDAPGIARDRARAASPPATCLRKTERP